MEGEKQPSIEKGRAPKPKETIPRLYVELVKCSWQANSDLSRILREREDFARFPDEAYQLFQNFISTTKEKIPNAIKYTNQRDPENTNYYFPGANMIYGIPGDMSTDPKYDPNSEQFIGLENIKKEKGGIFPFEGEEADINSIDSILKSISPFLTTDQVKSLFQTATEAIDKLKQQFDVYYNEKQREWTQRLRNQTVKLLQEIRNQVGEKKMPTHVMTAPLFGLMAIVGKTEIDTGKKMPYLSTREGKIIRAPVIEQKRFLKIAYVPDLTKAEDADAKEWLNPALPSILLDLIPRSIRRRTSMAAKDVFK